MRLVLLMIFLLLNDIIAAGAGAMDVVDVENAANTEDAAAEGCCW
jgi:hypothetical protein